MKKRHQNVGIVTFPISDTGYVPLSYLAHILYYLSNELYVITGYGGKTPFKKADEIHVFEVQHKGGTNLFTRVVNYVCTQLKISFRLAKLSRRVKLWIFFFGAEPLILPLLTAKLLRRQVVLAIAGLPCRADKVGKAPLFNIIDLLSNINLALFDRIIVYSERIVAEQNLEKHRSKISIAQEHFLDFNKFKIQRPLSQRNNLIAYIGRLSKEKGILNFMEALPRILDKRSGISFLIGGDGQLRGKVEEYLGKANLNRKASFIGWVPHDELPGYLNEVKLLVLPSYYEGLPNIMLEAMACSTPVLATAVGAIPDVIKDGETGFIMEDNSPDCIASNVIRALGHPNLEQIAENARVLVEKEYNFKATVKAYEDILTSLR